MTGLRLIATALALMLAGCANLPPDNSGIDGVACVGALAAPAAALNESSNPSLLSKAQFPSGKGGVCTAKVFAATAPVVLYRVFDSSKPYTRFGGWWSLKRPAGSRADYRQANAICPEWSALDRLVACEVRPGTQVVLGTTQSAECADGTLYPKTGETQVFVPNDSRVGIVHVGNCSDETAWP